MKENDVYFLDCVTKDMNLRMTTFSARLEDLIADFAGWLKGNGITVADVGQPKLYRVSDMACFAVLCLEDGQVILQPRRTYAGPFAKLVNTAVFEVKMRCHALQCAIHGRRVLYREERVKDDLPPGGDEAAPENDPEDPEE